MKARLDEIGRLDAAAAAALDAGDYAEAEADAQRSVSLGVASGKAQELLASALYAQGKDREALQVYQKIAQGGAYAGRNEWPYAMLLLKAGRWEQAVAAYNTALQLGGDMDLLRANSGFSPTQPQPQELASAIHIGMGISMDGGDFHGTYQNRCEQSLAHFRQALAMVPDSPVANYYHGHGLKRIGRQVEAREAFQKAASLDQTRGTVEVAAEKEIK